MDMDGMDMADRDFLRGHRRPADHLHDPRWLITFKLPRNPARGILRIETTRGDRLFITLLGSAFINAGWLASSGLRNGGPWEFALIYAAAVFRWV